MIGIVDYNAGNIKSVERALTALGISYVISKNPEDLKDCSKLIFPGVGEAAYAMDQLKKSGFDVFLRNWVKESKPLLGICLGSQIIFEYSEEGDTQCLGKIKRKIRHFNSLDDSMVKKGIKIPHMGWNNLDFLKPEDKIFTGIDKNAAFYFVHSYLIQPENPEVILATADYGVKVPSAIKSKNIYAFQFHPEKSGEWGLKLLQNFINL